MSDSDSHSHGDDEQVPPTATSPLVDLDDDDQSTPDQTPNDPQTPSGSKPSSRVTSPEATRAEGESKTKTKFRFGAGGGDGTSKSSSFAATTPPRRSPFSPSGARTDKTPILGMKPRTTADDTSGSPSLRTSDAPQSILRRRTKTGKDLVVEAVTTEQVVLQQEAIHELIGYIKQDPAKVFNSSRVLNTQYQEFSSVRASRLYKFFYELYRYGFGKFDKQTEEILQTYLTYCSRIFDEVATKDDKHDFSTQARFLTISICFGIDRALTGLKYKDGLFREFRWVTQDNFHSEVYDKAELVQRVPELPTARFIYSEFFRKDSFNPEVEGKIPIVGSKGVFFNDITHHGFTTPVQHGRFAQKSPFFRNFSPNDGNDDQGKQKFTYSSQHSEPAGSSQDPGTNNPGPRSSTKPKTYDRGTDAYTDSDQDYAEDCIKIQPPRTRPTGVSESRPQSQSRPGSRPGSRQRFSDRVSRCIYTPESEADSYDSDSNYSDPTNAKIPLHQQTPSGVTGTYFGDRISTAGHVYDSSRTRVRRSPRKSQFIDKVAQELNDLELDDQQKVAVLGTSLGIAHSINAFTKEGQRQQHDSIRVIQPPPEDLDLRVDSFDYDRDGSTAEEILGRRFSKLRFPSEAVRLSTLRSIFNRVVNDPASSPRAQHIALNQLGQFDHPKLTKQEVEHYVSRSISRMDSHPDPGIIPPPVLGNNAFDNKTSKTLQARTGLHEKFSFDELSPGQLRNVLNNISAVITNAGLRNEEAYAFLRGFTKGVTYDTSLLAEFDQKIPFCDYWISLQKTQKRTSSAREHEKTLKHLLQSERVDNLEKTLNMIMISTFKTHENELDPSYRMLVTQRECLKNFRTFIRRHYSPYFSQINTCFMDRLRQVALEKNDPTFTNENIFHHQKVQIFLEIACEILAQYEPEESTPFRSNHHRQQNSYVHEMEIEEQQVYVNAMVSDDHQPSKPQQNNHQAPQDHQQERPPSRFNQRSNTPGPYSQRSNTPGPYNTRPNTPGPYNNRSSTPGPGRQQQNRDYPNNQRQQQPQRPQSRVSTRRRPLYSCFLCGIQGHSFRECKKYPGMEPSNQHCTQCGGTHKGECKSRRRPQTPGPSTQIAAIEAIPMPQQPVVVPQQPVYQPRPNTPYQGQNYQNYQQNGNRPPSRGYNPQYRQWNNNGQQNYQGNDQRGRQPYQNNGQQQYQGNNQGYFRSQSRGDGRPPYNNYQNNGQQNGQRFQRPRSQSGYRNDGRRSQSGYNNYRNPDRRNYNDRRYNGNGSNFTPLGQQRQYDNRGYNNGNNYNNYGPKQYDQRDPDQGRTTPFFKPQYYNQQNSQQAMNNLPKDAPQATANGIGNTGFQQVPITARLSALAAEDNSSYDLLSNQSSQ